MLPRVQILLSAPSIQSLIMNRDQYEKDRRTIWDRYIKDILNDKEHPLRIFSLDMAYLLIFGDGDGTQPITHPDNEEALEKFLIDRGYDKIIIREFNTKTRNVNGKDN